MEKSRWKLCRKEDDVSVVGYGEGSLTIERYIKTNRNQKLTHQHDAIPRYATFISHLFIKLY